MSNLLDRFRKHFSKRSTIIHVGALTVGLIAYWLGFTQLLVPLIISSLAFSFPFPAVIKSLLSRTVIAVMLFYAVFQAAATIVFLVSPGHSFAVLATVVTLVAIILQGMFGTNLPRRIVTKNDCFAVLAALLFVVPIAVYCLGPNGNYRTTSLGGIQAIDGANHTSFIAKAAQDQGILYTKGDNYPNAYHVTTAFVNDSYGLTGPSLTWNASLKLYVLQYLSLGFILSFTAYYVAISVLNNLLPRKKGRDYTSLATALGLAVPLVVLYLLPFLYNGFLNYFYICATILCGLLYLSESKASAKNTAALGDRWIGAYMLLAFAATANWPLLAPAFLLTAGLYLLPRHFKTIPKAMRTGSTLAMAGLLILNVLPVYFQSKYSVLDAAESLNLNGSLYGLHALVLAFGVILVLFATASEKISQQIAEFITNTLVPFFILVGGLALYQYFTIGEIRYYVIKSAYLVEILILVLFVALLMYYIEHRAVKTLGVYAVVASLPLMLFIFLIHTATNPLREVRSMFRAYSLEQKPPQFDNDVAIYTRLGEQNKLDDFNSISLHYNFTQDKFYTHTQISYWANVLKYTADYDGKQGAAASLQVYENQLYGTFTSADQQKLLGYIQDDIADAQASQKTFYIVTDKTSYPLITNEFGAQRGVQVLYE